jgi:RHS repeat-associated protein
VPITERAQGVARFRPRTECLLARIEHVQDAANDFWRVRSKDGLDSLYGTPASAGNDPAVVADPMEPSHVFAWHLSGTTDPCGNRIVYQYVRDRQLGDNDSHVWDQLYLERVQYVDYEQDGATRFLVSVTFVYEERPDPFSQYRSGFEIRTKKRCRRIAVQTHADVDRLIRIYELVYVDDRVQTGELPPTHLPRNGVSLLSHVRVVGHDGEATQDLPPLAFDYTAFDPSAQSFQPFSAVNQAMPPQALGHEDFEMLDLFGDGLPDIVYMNGTVRFWRNLGEGVFDAPQTMAEVPLGVALRDHGVQFGDLNGDGRSDLLVQQHGGYFPLSFKGHFSRQGFVRYEQMPTFDLQEPEVRFLDLDGDGVVDLLKTGVAAFELFLSDPEKGFATVETRPRIPNLAVFPNVSFADPHVKLGDMTGDGLQDIVFVRQGRIDYWPYLGHGRWGRRITMEHSPVVQDPSAPGDGLDPRRVLMGDVDGDGLDDFIYVQPGTITVWLNQSGNRWSEPMLLDRPPQPLTDIDDVRLADMRGAGTAGLLWTHVQIGHQGSTYDFLDLTGGVKPYLLHEMDNHMGAVTRVAYTPSTRFYLADQTHPETRWKRPLPFPVQVIERVEVIDALSGGKRTTEYHYHHGYWDGTEREFRGFGLVEQLDSESFADYHAAGAHGPGTPFTPVPTQHFAPPLLTKTWFHQGPVDEETGVWQEQDWSSDSWSGDPPLLAHTETINAFLHTLADPRHKRDALRTLRGSTLRTELYALDGTDRQERPYTVTEQAYGLREESPPEGAETSRPRIFFPHLLAQRTTHWERGDEPMTQFAFTDDYDAYGQSRRQVSVAVPRHRDYRAPAPAGAPYLGTLVETHYAQRDDAERYIVDRVSGSTSSEILNDGSPTVFELYRQVQAGTAPRKLFGQTCNYYDGDAFVGLPFGQLGDFGALVRSEALVLTEELLREAYRDSANAGAPDLPPYLRPEGATPWPAEYPQALRDETPALAGYTFADGSDHRVRGYFAQAPRVAFDFQMQMPGVPRRGLPVAMRDPLGHDTTTTYDRPYHLLPQQVIDPVGLTTRAEYDYRVLQPRLLTDANGNRRAVTFSPLGLVTATAVMGKAGEQVGDTLEAPGSRVAYDFFAFVKRQQPVFVRSIVREHHVTETDVPLPKRDETIETVEYSDGFGRLLQTRTQAEDVVFGDPSFGRDVLSADQASATGDAVGRRRAAGDPPYVVVSGWQVYDNKGRVVEKYEPFFAMGWDYGVPGDAQMGQKATMFYDPRGQVIRTLHPDGSEQRVIYGIPADLAHPDQFTPTPWEAYTYDANDLAPLSQGPDGASLANAAPPTHHFTPSSIVIDALGRTSEAIARNGTAPADWFRTRSTYDMRGNVLTVTDALNRVAFRYTYDLANRPWRSESIDAGLRRMVLNVLGNETERRDSKGALILQAYDRLQRPIRLWARDAAGSPITLRQRMEYGDAGMPDQAASERAARQATNLLGRLHRHHDEAGLTTVAVVDFKGNVLDTSRRVIADAPILAVFAQAPAHAWQVMPFQVDWEPRPQHTLAERESELLEGTAYQTTTSVDALNRLKRMQFPQDVEGQRRELRPAYNRAGGLAQVWLDDTLYVERIAYNAKGQRTLLAYGNGVMTRYAYDPHTFRLQRLRSEGFSKLDAVTYRPNSEALQDFGYDYDLVGNMLGIRDRAPGSGILNNPEALTTEDPVLAQLLVSGNALNRRFDYDPIYRLLSATGRECAHLPDGSPWQDQPRCIDLTRSRTYTEQYRYDAMGNMLRLEHRNDAGGFTREFTLETVDNRPSNNRLHRMQIGNTEYDYAFDTNGNMRSETLSRHFEWSHADQMKTFRTQTKGAEPSVHVHYLYDAAGQRVKKLVRKQGGQVEVTHYMDAVFEHHRWGGQSQAGENNHVHVLDNSQRIALVRLGPAHPDDRGLAVQFHLGDHLGSSNVVVDASGALTNREEYTPYGETSFGSFARKRYRFTSKERDEESGLNYHAARYYAMWLGRWVSTDPIGIDGGVNLYIYCTSSPVTTRDLHGTSPEPPPDKQVVTVKDLAASRDLGNAQTIQPEPTPAIGMLKQLWNWGVARGRALISTLNFITVDPQSDIVDPAENIEAAAREITSKPKPAAQGGSPPEPPGTRLVTAEDLAAGRNLDNAQPGTRLVTAEDLAAGRNLGNAPAVQRLKPGGGGGRGPQLTYEEPKPGLTGSASTLLWGVDFTISTANVLRQDSLSGQATEVAAAAGRWAGLTYGAAACVEFGPYAAAGCGLFGALFGEKAVRGLINVAPEMLKAREETFQDIMKMDPERRDWFLRSTCMSGGPSCHQ